MTTFVLRLQVPDPPGTAADAALRGTVDEVATGLTSTFRSGADLLGVLTDALVRAAATTATGTGPARWTG